MMLVLIHTAAQLINHMGCARVDVRILYQDQGIRGMEDRMARNGTGFT
jgi:hypothetical protein